MELILGTCRVRMDFSFPAMLAVIFLQAEGNLLRQTLAVCMIHEIGHGVAMLMTKAGIREIHLCAAGVQMRTNASLLSKGRELAIILSGPCVNLAAAAFLHFLHGWSDAAMLHLGMGLFNLLPYAVLDGGSAVACLLCEKPMLLRLQTVICLVLSIGISVLLVCFHIANPFLYLMCFYLAAAQLRVDKQGGMW